MRIALLVEGQTERVFLPKLREFLEGRVAGPMPNIDPVTYDGRLPKGERLKRDVLRLLGDRKRPADAVIALTDVYTGQREFADAADARAQMREWVGAEPRFHPHAAQYDFEAWLLPYWPTIQRLAGSNRGSPGPHPENVDHDKPPSVRIREVFLAGTKGKAYSKTRDAARILRENDLSVAASACPELKAFLNTVLTLSGGAPMP
jgi:hypothetical protein